jgi:hypothetical protein
MAFEDHTLPKTVDKILPSARECEDGAIIATKDVAIVQMVVQQTGTLYESIV